MPSPNLDRLCGAGLLHAEPPAADEYAGLLFDHDRHTLEELGKQPGTLALIFGKAQNKFDSHRLVAMLTLRAPWGRPISGGDCQDPAKLRRVIVDLIGAEDWSAMGADAKGDTYLGLLGRSAQDIKSGAGQYFTPRALNQLAAGVTTVLFGVLGARGAGASHDRSLIGW
ncbi:MAG: SAM-dependent DNA methyltransferase [Rhodocyclaceae bacterium]|nr:SAM-dependent DNA methyltransferase [Rhodocyclaceae bacterium]